MMIARRLVVTLALLALVSNGLVSARSSAAAKPGSDGQAFTVVGLKHEMSGTLTRIFIESSAPPLYTILRPTERTVVIDLPGGEGSQLAPEYAVMNPLIESIKVRKVRAAGSAEGRLTTRVEVITRQEVSDWSSVKGTTLVIELAPEQFAHEKTALKQAKEVRAVNTRASADGSAPGVYVYPTPVSARNSPATSPGTAGSDAGTAGAQSSPEPAQPQQSLTRNSPVKPATLIRSVRPEAAGGGVRITVDSDGTAQFKDFVLSDPWRIVIDVTGVRSSFGNRVIPVGAGSVDRVRIGQPGADVVRIVVDTKTKVQYRIVREGASITILVGNAQMSRVNPQNTGTGKPLANVVAQQPAPSNMPGSLNPEVRVAGERVENPNDSTSLIAQAGKSPMGGAAQSDTSPRVTAQPNPRLPVSSGQPSGPSGAPVKEAAGVPGGAAYTRSSMDVQRPNTAAPGAAVPGARQRGELAFCDPGYAGGLISFDLRAGVDVRDMLRFISQEHGVNFIVDKSVGAVPVDIRVTDIPWNQVIESVLRANRLGAVCESNGRIIRIATLTAVKEEQEQQRLLREEEAKQVPLSTKILHLKYARAAGSLGATGSGASGRGGGGGEGGGGGGGKSGSLLTIAGSRLSPRGRIEMDSRTNSLIITDLPEYVQAVESIIGLLDRPEPQVEIEARIVIASRNFLRDVGAELAGAAVNQGRGSAGLFETTPVRLNGNAFTPGGTGAGSGAGSGSGSGSGPGSGSGSGSGSGTTSGLGPNLVGPFASNALRAGVANTVLSLTTGAIGTGLLSLAISASETKGQIRTIASPRITAQDNQTAEIVNGVQIPVQTVSNNTITTTFVTAALRLEITPQIIEETGEVLMHVVAENNTVNFALAGQFNNGTPGINTQSAESIVRVQDGGTTVMGGINIDSEGQTLNRTPGLSRVPVVGELFKRKSVRRDSDEILFFITPRIVRGDGTIGPRTFGPQRSSVEPGAPNSSGAQRAAAPNKPAVQNKAKNQKSTQTAQQVKAGGGK